MFDGVQRKLRQSKVERAKARVVMNSFFESTLATLNIES